MNTRSKTLVRQQGAILVTSLLLLLILTVLGVAVMRMTGMQERMAGNTRDVNLALQGSEAALRDGENQLRLLVAEPAQYGLAVPCAICDQAVLPVDIDDPSSFNWVANGTAGQATAGLLVVPRYTIEYTAFARDEFGVGHESNVNGRPVFTVTARSTGASGQTNTVLQSTYARRF